MTAYHLSMDDAGVAFVTDPRAVSPDLTGIVESIAREYADPLLIVHPTVLSGTSCCSDHQSYAESGYPSVGLIEPRGYTGDPQYHKVGDVVRRDDYDVEQITMTAQVALAVSFHFRRAVHRIFARHRGPQDKSLAHNQLLATQSARLKC